MRNYFALKKIFVILVRRHRYKTNKVDTRMSDVSSKCTNIPNLLENIISPKPNKCDLSIRSVLLFKSSVSLKKNVFSKRNTNNIKLNVDGIEVISLGKTNNFILNKKSVITNNIIGKNV